VLTLVAVLALAQVNAEVLRPAPWKGGLSLGADGSLFLSRGNVVFLDAGGALRAQWQSLHPPEEGETTGWVRQRVFAVVNGRYSDTARGPIVNQSFAHARWTAMWHPRIGTDVFAQYQANLFLRMQARAVGGAGLRVEAVRTPHFALWGGSAVMFEYDRRSPLAGSSERTETFDVRWSSYLTARVALFDARLLVQNTTYAQPRLDDFSDARFLNETELMARVVDPLMLGVTVSVLHDTQPPQSVVPTDLRLLVVLRFTLELAT
jgi:hypothetical protein